MKQIKHEDFLLEFSFLFPESCFTDDMVAQEIIDYIDQRFFGIGVEDELEYLEEDLTN